MLLHFAASIAQGTPLSGEPALASSACAAWLTRWTFPEFVQLNSQPFRKSADAFFEACSRTTPPVPLALREQGATRDRAVVVTVFDEGYSALFSSFHAMCRHNGLPHVVSLYLGTDSEFARRNYQSTLCCALLISRLISMRQRGQTLHRCVTEGAAAGFTSLDGSRRSLQQWSLGRGLHLVWSSSTCSSYGARYQR